MVGESLYMRTKREKSNVLFKAGSRHDDDLEDSAPDSLQKQALEIREPPEGFDPHSAPQDGEHYLMQMAYERRRVPAIVVKRPKSLATQPHPQTEEHNKEAIVLPPFGLPTEQWKEVQLQDFLALRQRIQRVREQLTAENYDHSLEVPLTRDAQQWRSFCQQHKPSLKVIMRIGQRDLENLLEILADCLRERTEGVSESEDESEAENTVSGSEPQQEPQQQEQVESTTTTSLPMLDLLRDDKWLGLWLYATLACLQLPLEGHVHFSLRHIARLCVKQRERLQLHDDEQKATPYNLLICLIARAFDQLDFKDFV